jgi:cysteinyl-tRNA synthetase
MSKSLGNFFTIREVLKVFDAETIRFFVVRSHYRSPLNYSDVHLNDARNALKRLYTALEAVPPAPVSAIDWQQPHAQRFQAAMNEDFGTSEAVAVLFDLASEVNRHLSAELSGLLKALGGVLGLLQQVPQAFLQTGVSLSEADIQAQIQARALVHLLHQGPEIPAQLVFQGLHQPFRQVMPVALHQIVRFDFFAGIQPVFSWSVSALRKKSPGP